MIILNCTIFTILLASGIFPVPVTSNATPTTEVMLTETNATGTTVTTPTETTVADETTTSQTRSSVIDTTARAGKGLGLF